MSDREHLLVVGNGMAGARLVEQLLDLDDGEHYAVTVLGDEPYGSYNRIRLGEVVSVQPDEHPEWPVGDELFLNPAGWYAEHGVTLHYATRAARLDRAARVVTDAGGRRHGYDRLVLATGSRPVLPPVEGLTDGDGAGVFAYRTLDDAVGIHRAAAGARRAVVVGGGVLGLEAARALQTHDLEVHVAHSREVVMDRQLDDRSAGPVHDALAELGVSLHLGHHVERLHRRAGGAPESVELDDGTVVPTDLVVLTAGTRPDVDLAREAGLAVEHGVLVDDHLRSVDDHRVYAVGECAEHRGAIYGLVGPAWEQAEVAAAHLADLGTRYHGSSVATKCKADGVDVAALGEHRPSPGDDLVEVTDSRAGVYQRLVIRDDTLAGAVLVGDTRGYAHLTQAIDNRYPLPPNTADLLVGGSSTPSSPQDLPDDASVCLCRGVTAGELRAADEDGDVDTVCAATGAGSGCGSCRGTVAEIVAGPAAA